MRREVHVVYVLDEEHWMFIMTSNKSLLTELKYFVNGVPNLHRGLPADVSAQLVKCSLTLLEELSTSREVILEYFAMIFDESVKNYVALEVSRTCFDTMDSIQH